MQPDPTHLSMSAFEYQEILRLMIGLIKNTYQQIKDFITQSWIYINVIKPLLNCYKRYILDNSIPVLIILALLYGGVTTFITMKSCELYFGYSLSPMALKIGIATGAFKACIQTLLFRAGLEAIGNNEVELNTEGNEPDLPPCRNLRRVMLAEAAGNNTNELTEQLMVATERKVKCTMSTLRNSATLFAKSAAPTASKQADHLFTETYVFERSA